MWWLVYGWGMCMFVYYIYYVVLRHHRHLPRKIKIEYSKWLTLKLTKWTTYKICTDTLRPFDLILFVQNIYFETSNGLFTKIISIVAIRSSFLFFFNSKGQFEAYNLSLYMNSQQLFFLFYRIFGILGFRMITVVHLLSEIYDILFACQKMFAHIQYWPNVDQYCPWNHQFVFYRFCLAVWRHSKLLLFNNYKTTKIAVVINKHTHSAHVIDCSNMMTKDYETTVYLNAS